MIRTEMRRTIIQFVSSATIAIMAACGGEKGAPLPLRATVSVVGRKAAAAVKPPPKPEPPPPECVDKEALTFATLDNICASIGKDLNPAEAELGDIAPSAITKQRHDVKCLRDWSNTVKPDCVRDRYEEWLDYYDTQLDECAKRLAVRDSGRETDGQKFERQTDIDIRHGEKLRRELMRPPAPCPLPVRHHSATP